MKLLALLLLLFSCFAVADLPKVSAGSIERLVNFSSEFIPSRHIDIWLPPGYNTGQQYAVLYMHDGQMLFDGSSSWNKQEWRVDEVASALIASGATQPFIVVGIFNGGARRHSEYFPQQPFNSLPEAVQQQLYQLQRVEHGGLNLAVCHQRVSAHFWWRCLFIYPLARRVSTGRQPGAGSIFCLYAAKVAQPGQPQTVF